MKNSSRQERGDGGKVHSVGFRIRQSRRTAVIMAVLMVFSVVYGIFDAPAMEAYAEAPGHNGPQGADPSSPGRYFFYAVEFSLMDDEGNTVSYATADVEKISIAEIAEQLGLTGEITGAEGSSPVKQYYMQEESDGWYLYTTSPTSNGTSGDIYTGDLFGGLPAYYYKDNRDIVITVDEVPRTVVMRFIATPIQLNDPGAVEGVTVGDTIYTFASGMPLSNVYIDNAHFEVPTSWEKLTDEPGFVLRVPTEFERGTIDWDRIWAIYDQSIDGAAQLDPTQETFFEGDLFSFTYENAAILWDGRVENVRITYSDAYITIDKRATDGFPYTITLACGKHMSVGSSDNTRGNVEIDGERYYKALGAGCRMTATIQIVDDRGEPIDGSFIACVEGVNVTRHGTIAIKGLENGYLYDFWSESVQVNGGTLSDIYVRPNDDEEEPDISGSGAPQYQRQWYYPYVTKNDRGVKFTGVRWTIPDGDALAFEHGRNNYYSAGFVTTADAHNGIRLENYSAGMMTNVLVYDTYYMDGYSIWHRIRSSSTGGGTIQTTTGGNADGSLSDGGTVLDPGTYVVPDGKTVVYTMTPDLGYELDSVTVKFDSLTYTGGEDVTAIVTPVYDDNGVIMYYTYEFPANMLNEAIHVKWKKGAPKELTVKKTTIGDDGTFTFHIRIEEETVTREAWKKVASWTTVWRQDYSFAHMTSVSYPIVLDGVTYDDDVELLTFTDDSNKLLLYGSCDENNTPASEDLTDVNGGTMTLYKALDAEGNPYTVMIDGKTYELYSDSKDWTVSGETGSNEANFWIYDDTNAVDNYYELFAQSESSAAELLDLSAYGGIPVEGMEGVYEFKITTINGEGSITLQDLPYGVSYSIEEQTQDGWQLIDSSETEGEITADKAAAFTNLRVGDLTVTKTVRGNAADPTREFTFIITLSDKTISGEYSGVMFTDGAAAITLKGGESKTIEDLPSGIGYVVEEADYSADGYVTTKTGDTGTIVGGDVQTAAFTNTRDAFGDLIVTKTVKGEGADRNKAFSFTVTLSDKTVNGEYSGVMFKDGVAAFTLKDGESKVIKGLPNGVGYIVEEADYSADGYVVTKNGDTGTIAENETSAAVFTNTKSIVPKTGDSSSMGLWLGIGGAAGAVMVLTVILGKKRRGKHDDAE